MAFVNSYNGSIFGAGRDGPGGSSVPSFLQDSYKASHPGEQFFTVNRGDSWANYSNKMGDQFLSQPELYDAIMNDKLKPLDTYKNADQAFQGFLGLSPNQGERGLQSWGAQWSPLFMPAQMKTQPGPVTGTPTPAKPPIQQQPNPAPGTVAQTTPTSGLAWANSPWQQNMLMQGDRYGEFGTSRGL